VEAIDEGIWRAGRKQGWEIERTAPGRLRGTRRWKRHAAVVSITHDGSRLQLAYEDSENLLHDGDRIHRNYDTAVQRLLGRIAREPILPVVQTRGAAKQERP
jgi:hypothetical protein